MALPNRQKPQKASDYTFPTGEARRPDMLLELDYPPSEISNELNRSRPQQDITQRAHGPELTVEDVVALIEAHCGENTEWFSQEEGTQAILDTHFDNLYESLNRNHTSALTERPSPPPNPLAAARPANSQPVNAPNPQTKAGNPSQPSTAPNPRAQPPLHQISTILKHHPHLITPIHAHFDARRNRLHTPPAEYYLLDTGLLAKARMTLRLEGAHKGALLHNQHQRNESRGTEQVQTPAMLRVEVVTGLGPDGGVARKPLLCLPAGETGWLGFRDALVRVCEMWEWPGGVGEREGGREEGWRYLVEPDSARLVRLDGDAAFAELKGKVVGEGRGVVVIHEKMLAESKRRRREHRERSKSLREDPIMDQNGEMFFEDIGFEEALLRPGMRAAESLSLLDGLKNLTGNRYRG